MKHHLRRYVVTITVALSWLPMAAQLYETGYYRIRNVGYPTHYISIANDKLDYGTVISNAGGGLSALMSSAGQSRALACAGLYLQTDIHLEEDANCMNPATIIYLKFSSGSKYDLIAQSTSLTKITTGEYSGTIALKFKDIYASIIRRSGSGADSKYTASVELKASNYSLANLGTRYFVDNNGTFAISESYTSDNAKWYIEQLTSFNVNATVEYKGKYYCTMYTPFAYKLSGQTLAAYVISGNADGTVVKTCIATNENGAAVPAGTPVILECGSNVPANCQLIPQGEPRIDDTSDYTGTNLLKGAYFCNTDGSLTYQTSKGTGSFSANNYTSYNASTMLVFGKSEDPAGVERLGFFKYTGDEMKSNKVWLDISNSANGSLTFDPEN